MLFQAARVASGVKSVRRAHYYVSRTLRINVCAYVHPDARPFTLCEITSVLLRVSSRMVQMANNHPVRIILSEYSFRRRDIARHRRQRASLRFIAFINLSRSKKKKKTEPPNSWRRSGKRESPPYYFTSCRLNTLSFYVNTLRHMSRYRRGCRTTRTIFRRDIARAIDRSRMHVRRTTRTIFRRDIARAIDRWRIHVRCGKWHHEAPILRDFNLIRWFPETGGILLLGAFEFRGSRRVINVNRSADAAIIRHRFTSVAARELNAFRACERNESGWNKIFPVHENDARRLDAAVRAAGHVAVDGMNSACACIVRVTLNRVRFWIPLGEEKKEELLASITEHNKLHGYNGEKKKGDTRDGRTVCLPYFYRCAEGLLFNASDAGKQWYPSRFHIRSIQHRLDCIPRLYTCVYVLKNH